MISKALPSIKVEKVEMVEGDYHVYATPKDEPTGCPECGWVFYKHDVKTQLIMDIPHGSHRVGIRLARRRYKCRGPVCGITFMQQCSDVDDRHRATKRLVKYIEQRSIEHPCTHVAEDVGLDEKTIRNILNKYIEGLEKQYSFETPAILGVDELHLNGEPRLILTNIEERTILDLRKDRVKPTLVQALYRFKDMKKIKFVTMDMWPPYRDAVYETLGRQTIVVIDKFHVVKMANEAVEKGRKALREEMGKELAKALKHDRFVLLKREDKLKDKQRFALSGWAENYPDLKALHSLKERFFKIFDSDMNSEQAGAAYDAWEKSIPNELAKHFFELTRAMRNWRREILNYFDTHLTNAYTESANNHVKSVYKKGRGYSFDVLRARVLYLEAKHKRKRKPFKNNLPSGSLGFMKEETINYGVEFPHDDSIED